MALLLWSVQGSAQAQRRLLSPSSEQPAQLAPGGVLSLTVESATALTPPPGVQEERAHRAFAIALCADGLPLGAPARRCFPLLVRNVRPLDGASLRYRVEAPLPAWVAPGSYDLSARFPGAALHVPGGVRVQDDAPLLSPAQVREQAGAWLAQAGPAGALLRVHAGAQGLSISGAQFTAYPLPHPEQGFERGYVALCWLSPGQSARIRAGSGAAPPGFAIEPARATAGRPLTLRAGPVPGQGRVFWWWGQDAGAVGPSAQAWLAQRGSASVQALLVTADGAVSLAEQRVPIEARHAAGCSAWAGRTGRARPGWLGLWGLAGLLAGARSWKLRGRQGRDRRREARE